MKIFRKFFSLVFVIICLTAGGGGSDGCEPSPSGNECGAGWWIVLGVIFLLFVASYFFSIPSRPPRKNQNQGEKDNQEEQ